MQLMHDANMLQLLSTLQISQYTVKKSVCWNCKKIGQHSN